jgi:carboxyl-terminal processing protease
MALPFKHLLAFLCSALPTLFSAPEVWGQTRSVVVPFEIRAYVNRALDLMEQHSLRKNRVDWKDLRASVLARVSGDGRPTAKYDAIRYALGLLGDHHGRLLLPSSSDEERSAYRAGVAFKPPYIAPSGQIENVGDNPGIARIVVPRYLADDHEVEFATEIQNLLRQLSTENPIGWIVDLRGNGGGNMWPMLAGIGPLLGPGECGGFINADGVRTSWSYENGHSVIHLPDGRSEILGRVSGEAFSFPVLPPVAVLIDGDTGSSGEIIAIAFRGRPATQFFGSHSGGLSTAVKGYELSDRAKLILEEAVTVDRSGKRYEDGLDPDVVLSDKAPGNYDPIVKAACDWLASVKSVK